MQTSDEAIKELSEDISKKVDAYIERLPENEREPLRVFWRALLINTYSMKAVGISNASLRGLVSYYFNDLLTALETVSIPEGQVM